MITARLQETRPAENQVHRLVNFTMPDGTQRVLWWHLTGPAHALPAAPERHDMAASALIFVAMRARSDLHIEGPVSRSLLRNLRQFSLIWSSWRPDLYAAIQVTADAEITGPFRSNHRAGRGVCAYSGGVDGTATFWRHYTGAAGIDRKRLHCAVLIHGFDLPLDNPAAFDTAFRTASSVIEPLEVPLVQVASNWRRDICTEWEMEFSCGVLSCLRQFETEADALLMGSGEDYNHLVFPWGSNPLTDRLFASDELAIVYDGGEMTRTAKVASFADWKEGYNALRVCWQGEVTGRNCGVCEKCLRTKLNALACGLELPRSLAGRPSLAKVAKILVRNPAQLVLLREIMETADAAQLKDPIFSVLKFAVRKNEAALIARKVKCGLKSVVKRQPRNQRGVPPSRGNAKIASAYSNAPPGASMPSP